MESKGAVAIFEAHGRRARFNLPLQEGKDAKAERSRKQRWRALLLCIKAKLESVVLDQSMVGDAKQRETRQIGSVQVVFVETAQGGVRFQYGFMIIADEFWTVGAIAFDPALDITSAFDRVLNQLVTAPIKRRSLAARDYGLAIGYGLGIAFIPALVVAFIFCVVMLISISAAYFYGVFFVHAIAPDTSEPFYRQPFVWGVAGIAAVLAALLAALANGKG